MSELMLTEHASSSYGPRTAVNAASAEITVAFAIDFSTAGEALTKKVAGERYLAIDLRWEPLVSARVLYQTLRKQNARAVNIAGNGIYTLALAGWTQEGVEQYLYDVISLCHQHWSLTAIRSGGQTGVDEAGLVVACALSIPATGLYPKGFKQRNVAGTDILMTEPILREQIQRRASEFHQRS